MRVWKGQVRLSLQARWTSAHLEQVRVREVLVQQQVQRSARRGVTQEHEFCRHVGASPYACGTNGRRRLEKCVRWGPAVQVLSDTNFCSLASVCTGRCLLLRCQRELLEVGFANYGC